MIMKKCTFHFNPEIDTVCGYFTIYCPFNLSLSISLIIISRFVSLKAILFYVVYLLFLYFLCLGVNILSLKYIIQLLKIVLIKIKTPMKIGAIIFSHVRFFLLVVIDETFLKYLIWRLNSCMYFKTLRQTKLQKNP